MEKQLRLALVFTFLFYICNHTASIAQSLQRQTISTTGTSTTSDGTLIRQTIGQPYNTATNYGTGITYRPGFQQPVISVQLIQSNLSLTVFPNPTSDYVTIESPVNIDNVTLRLVDDIGKLLYTETFEHFKTYQLSCAKYVSGLYVITISAPDKKSFSAKLIINR